MRFGNLWKNLKEQVTAHLGAHPNRPWKLFDTSGRTTRWERLLGHGFFVENNGRHWMGGLLCLFAGNVLAENQDPRNKPGALPMGPFDLIPDLQVLQGYDDNIFLNNQNQKSSWVTLIRPGVQLALERALNRFALSYGFQSSVFWDSPQDNFVDHFLRGDAHVEVNRSNRFDLNAQLLHSHYQRGTYFSQGGLINVINEPDEFHDYEIGGKYIFGTRDAKGRIELDVDYLDLRFDNHLERTRVRNRQNLTLSPIFFAQILPKTQALIQFEYQRRDYPDAVNTPLDFSGDIKRYLVGATWQQTVKTTGTIKIGYLQAEFDQSNRIPNLRSFSDITYDVIVRWRPMTYSTLEFEASRNVVPTQGFGYSIATQTYGLRWNHQWDPRFATQMGVTYSERDNLGVNRNDTFVKAKLELRYRMRRWLHFGLSYSYGNFESTQSRFDYQRNVVMFTVTTNPLAENYLESIY